MKKKILIFLVIILGVIQFFRIDKNNPKVDQQKDFFTLTDPSEEIKTQFKTSCYDCHSNETVYPWYSNVAPVSWFLKGHINEGREKFNFSEWGNFTSDKQRNILEDCEEEIETDEMPLSAYTLMHSEAKLDDNKKALLTDWLKKQIKKGYE